MDNHGTDWNINLFMKTFLVSVIDYVSIMYNEIIDLIFILILITGKLQTD